MATEQSTASRNFSGYVRGVMPTVDSTLHALNHGHQHGATGGDVIIDIPGNTAQDENENTGGGTQNGGIGNATASLADLRIAGTWVEKIIPFVIVVLLKTLVDHRLGLIVLIGMFGTFLHFNGSLKRQVALKEKRNFFTLLVTMTFMPLNMLFIYYVFTEHQLQNCLILMKPNFDQIDIWNLFWIVGITDFIIKFITIAAKCLVTLLPKSWLGYKVRGKYYLFIEQCSQFYRLLPPVPVWCSYLSDDTYSHWILTYCLVFIYLIAKARTVFDRTLDVRKAWKNLFSDVVGSSILLHNGCSLDNQ
uniref:RING finger and transmembrane domain-containing protein 2-like n=1 Tax=Saccoglossus kowalevskii TaxID=10224 RepID=A0ABM0LVK9_SACKO|nr:PREDICTED: RING finger and transmembrane domain-containing protein 2-like [Saccoglossus kowalevskii]